VIFFVFEQAESFVIADQHGGLLFLNVDIASVIIDLHIDGL
jgi:hypothetical protein